jgi:hypothetical protein
MTVDELRRLVAEKTAALRQLERDLNQADAELVKWERLLEEAEEAEQGCQRRIPGASG